MSVCSGARQVFGRVAAIRPSADGECARPTEEKTDAGGCRKFQYEIVLWREDRCQSYRIAAKSPPCAAGDLVCLTLNDEGRAVSLRVLTRAGAHECDDLMRWRKPEAGQRARMYYLKLRHQFLRAAQVWFDRRGFTELTMPVLLPAVNPEAHLSLARAESGWLSPSPELQMKRMLVGGFERIVSIGPVFRARENSALHNPEFSMIEWYQAWAGLDLILEQLEDLAHTLWTHSPLNAGDGFLRVTRGGKEKLINMDARPWPKIPILNIIHDALGLDLEGVTEADELCARGKSAGLFTEDHSGERYEELFTRLWERCECALDFSTPVFITHWPAPLASLARLDPAAPALALRAELLIVGVEIANGFEELTDPEEQRARFVRDIQIRNEMRPDTPPVKIDEKFLDALEAGLPPCAGMALGFERLVMLLSGAEEIRQVLAFAHEEL